MITESEVADYLERELPEITRALHPANPKPLKICGVMFRFMEYTRDMAAEHNYTVAKKCLRLAAALYRQGDRAVRCAVDNVFVFSLDSIVAAYGRERKLVMAQVPAVLRELYVNQVNYRGC